MRKKIDELERRLPSLTYRNVVIEVGVLQKLGLQGFVGNKDLTEASLREVISKRFNVKILEKPES